MPPRTRRRTLVRLRLRLRGLRQLLRPYRLLIACTAGGIGAALGAVYNDINNHLRVITILAIAVLTAIAVLLTEPAPVPKVREQVYRQRQPAATTKTTAVEIPGARTPESSSYQRPSPRTNGEKALGRPVAGRNATSLDVAARSPLWPVRLWRAPARAVRSLMPSWRKRGRIAPAAPHGDALFRGRERELVELRERHREERAARRLVGAQPAGMLAGGDASRSTTGPILLLIHGMPGVGKSALALELARQLARHFPQGQLYANLGTLGEARAPGEILKEFLDALGWPADEMPATTVERAKLFRSLTTGRRVLFILDAARTPAQVVHLLPSDPLCTVIVTSRRDLGPELNTTSYPLDVPDMDEAITILRAASGTDDGSRPECAVEIVESCGALPLALRAAAERASLGGTELCHVASLLRQTVVAAELAGTPGHQRGGARGQPVRPAARSGAAGAAAADHG